MGYECPRCGDDVYDTCYGCKKADRINELEARLDAVIALCASVAFTANPLLPADVRAAATGGVE